MPSADLPGSRSDTIAAVATPPGRGGIGIVRVSGPLAADLARALTGGLPEPRVATYARVSDPQGQAIDQGLSLFFPGPRSYTGEDVFEFHGHGGDAVLAGILDACITAGARPAKAGEFTQRAFLNGKLDLAQAEAVADLIDAASAEAARAALRSLSGEFSAEIAELVRELVELRALVEAMLDFPEEDVDVLHASDARARLARIQGRHQDVMRHSQQGSMLREGIRVVITGRPNVGKSSILNRLAGEDRAIVTAIPGTTRDPLREMLRIEGVPLHVVDTAGLREGGDEVERIGMERTWRELAHADLVLMVLDAAAGLVAADQAILERLPSAVPRLLIFNKVDLLAPGASMPPGPGRSLQVSARTGHGLGELRREIVAAAGWRTGGEPVFLARARHLHALRQAGDHLAAAASDERQWELLAEHLRLAQQALASITGAVSADELLGEIFSRFCIGK
jgi:tRNA modification GTPase